MGDVEVCQVTQGSGFQEKTLTPDGRAFDLARERKPVYYATLHMSTLEITAIIVGILAGTAGVAGFFLRIVGLWYQWNTTRPRLVVRPSLHCMGEVKDGNETITWYGIIEICNVGHVPVVGATAGFLPGWRWRAIEAITKFAPKRIRESKAVWSLQRREFHSVTMFQQEPVRKGLEWQKEVGPQQSAMIRFNPVLLRAQPPIKPDEPRIGRAYATTIVGDTFKASRRDMRRFIQQVEEFRLNQPLPATPCTSPPTSQPHGEAPGPAANTASKP